MLVARKRANETWREAAQRIARVCGLHVEVLDDFDRYVASGERESVAAWEALYNWDCLDFEDKPSR